MSDKKINFEQFRESLSSALKSEQDYRSAVQKCSNPKWLALSFQKNFHLITQLWKYYPFWTLISYFSYYIFFFKQKARRSILWMAYFRFSILKRVKSESKSEKKNPTRFTTNLKTTQIIEIPSIWKCAILHQSFGARSNFFLLTITTLIAAFVVSNYYQFFILSH